jgi:phage regulator Rha-like protein
MHYLKTVQAFRAIDTLKKFLTKVKPMTEALVSAFDEMEKLE